MPIVLDGASLAARRENIIRVEVEAWKAVHNETPTLATILVGNNLASAQYIRMKGRACNRVGMEIVNFTLPEDAAPEDVLETIDNLNRSPKIHGIMLQHPVPDPLLHLESDFFNAVLPCKDVDGVTSVSFGNFSLERTAFKPATPKGIMTLLEYYDISMKGHDVVIVGMGPILGKPLAMLMINEHATVTMCHRSTHHLEAHVRGATVVVGAAGVPNLIKDEWIRPNAILIDAGCNPGNIGDIERAAWNRSAAYTPVPGGVGPMTISTLLQQTMIATREIHYARNTG